MPTIVFSIEKRQNKIEWCKIKTRYYGPACINQPHGLGKRKSSTKVNFAFLKFRLNFTCVVSPWYSWTPVLSNCKRFCHESDANKRRWSWDVIIAVVIRASTGFEPALALQYFTNWAMKTHLLKANQFMELEFRSSSPVTGMRREMKLIWTAGIQLKLRCDHRSCNRNLSNCKFAGLHSFFFVGRSSYLCSLTVQGISYF